MLYNRRETEEEKRMQMKEQRKNYPDIKLHQTGQSWSSSEGLQRERASSCKNEPSIPAP
jgi:hypothetical protein